MATTKPEVVMSMAVFKISFFSSVFLTILVNLTAIIEPCWTMSDFLVAVLGYQIFQDDVNFTYTNSNIRDMETPARVLCQDRT